MTINETEGANAMDPELHTEVKLWPQAGDRGPNALCVLILALAQSFDVRAVCLLNIGNNINREKMFAFVGSPFNIFLLQSVHTRSKVFCQVHYI